MSSRAPQSPAGGGIPCGVVIGAPPASVPIDKVPVVSVESALVVLRSSSGVMAGWWAGMTTAWTGATERAFGRVA